MGTLSWVGVAGIQVKGRPRGNQSSTRRPQGKGTCPRGNSQSPSGVGNGAYRVLATGGRKGHCTMHVAQ